MIDTSAPENQLIDLDEPILLRISDVGVFCLPRVPHVHVHYLFSDYEAGQFGYTVHEFCCHYCGQASTIFADFNPVENAHDGLSPADLQTMRDSFEEFKEFHATCPTKQGQGSQVNYQTAYFAQLKAGDFDGFCPKVRGVSGVTDIRKKADRPN